METLGRMVREDDGIRFHLDSEVTSVDAGNMLAALMRTLAEDVDIDPMQFQSAIMSALNQ